MGREMTPHLTDLTNGSTFAAMYAASEGMCLRSAP